MSIPPPDPMWTLHLSLLALQVAVLVLTGGIFVTTMTSVYGVLSLLRRTVRDTSKTLASLEDFLDVLNKKSST